MTLSWEHFSITSSGARVTCDFRLILKYTCHLWRIRTATINFSENVIWSPLIFETPSQCSAATSSPHVKNMRPLSNPSKVSFPSFSSSPRTRNKSVGPLHALFWDCSALVRLLVLVDSTELEVTSYLTMPSFWTPSYNMGESLNKLSTDFCLSPFPIIGPPWLP